MKLKRKINLAKEHKKDQTKEDEIDIKNKINKILMEGEIEKKNNFN